MTPLKSMLYQSLCSCLKEVDAQSGSVFLLDDNHKGLVLEIAKNVNNISLEGVKEQIGERISGKVMLERKAFLVTDIDQELELRNIPKFNHYQTKSFLSCPLEFSGNIFGVINITDKTNGGIFNDNDLRAVLRYSWYIGGAVYAAKFYFENQTKQNEALTKELQSLRLSLERSEKLASLGKLVGSIIHEINNPLDGVMRYVNLAYESSKGKEEASQYLYLEEARRGLKQITKTIRSLLDFSRSFTPKEPFTNVNAVIEESLEASNHYIAASRIDVKKYFSPFVPDLPGCNLKLVFNNIIKNACQAMDCGGVLSIHTTVRDDNVEIRFKDTGEGIPEVILSKVLEPFFSTKPVGKGTGLGLSLCFGIVEAHGGRLKIKSQVGVGTEVKVVLPVKSPS